MLQSYEEFFPASSVSLYLHWPFCLSKCPYCGFNSYPIQDIVDFEAWEKAYLFSLEDAARTTAERTIRSIYFGGGTPSLMPPGMVARLLQKIYKLWSIDPRVEITLEMNPGRMTLQRIAGFKEAGVNRISLGVQSMTNEGLAILGRKHSVKDALNTLDMVAKHFNDYSIDLMYAWPSHTLSQFEDDLKKALELGSPHISLYQLVIEKNSIFGGMFHRGELLLPTDDVCADMYELAQEMTQAYGCPAYEISNHARPGFRSYHNVGYWLYRDYIGIGPGAHSRLNMNGRKWAMVADLNPQKWLTSILNNRKTLQEKAELTPLEQAREALLVGLRMVDGVDCKALPLPLQEAVKPQALQQLIDENYLLFDGDVLKATVTGRECLNALTVYLLK